MYCICNAMQFDACTVKRPSLASVPAQSTHTFTYCACMKHMRNKIEFTSLPFYLLSFQSECYKNANTQVWALDIYQSFEISIRIWINIIVLCVYTCTLSPIKVYVLFRRGGERERKSESTRDTYTHSFDFSSDFKSTHLNTVYALSKWCRHSTKKKNSKEGNKSMTRTQF